MNNSLRKNIRLIIENIDKNFVVCQNCFHSWDIKESDPRPYFCHSCGFDNKKKEFDIDGLKDWMKKYYQVKK